MMLIGSISYNYFNVNILIQFNRVYPVINEVNKMAKYVNRIPVLVSAKEVRDGKRYKQKEIAIASGLSEPIVSRLMRETEIGGITYSTARMIAQWLGVSTDDLAVKEE